MMIPTSWHVDGPVDAANDVACVVAVAGDESAAVAVVASAKPAVECNFLPAQPQRYANVDGALGSNVMCRSCRSTKCCRVRQCCNM